VPRVPLDGALHLAAFRPALLVARLARLLRGTRPLPDRRCNKISGHAGEADEHHGVDHIEQGIRVAIWRGTSAATRAARPPTRGS
jgi:hypothetical protein